MCGIFGFFANRPLRDDDIALGRRGRDMLAHRGPDGAGEWLDPEKGVYLGHRRLAIIDLSSASSQPMAADGAVITFNGEIYNYVEVRQELAGLGERFQTVGDTEVLLRAWLRWQERCFERLDGMFAFALFDGVRLHLATDPFGEKPLYWARTPDGIWFSSEAPPLIELLRLRFAPSAAEAETFMALGFLPPPATGYPGLLVVPPATHLAIARDGSLQEKRYWQAPPAASTGGAGRPLAAADLDRIHAILVESLRRRVRSDVPIGLFLSGGVDSALIAAIAARDLKLQLQTFTVAFPDGADESAAAGAIAGFLGLPHTAIDSRAADDWRNTPARLGELYGIPNDNLTVMSVHQMSALARQRMTVALTGLGGDELFYGYNRHALLWRRRHLYRALPALLAPLAELGLSFRWLRKLDAAIDAFGGSRPWQFLSAKNNALGAAVRRLPAAAACIAGHFADNRRALVFQVRDFDVGVALPGSYIPAMDRGSMRVGLEVRTPFLSRALAEALGHLDHAALLERPKILLRRLLARYLPDALVARPKQGFVFPTQRYLETLDRPPPADPHLDPALVGEVWSRRRDPRYRGLALRALILEALAA